MLNNGISLLIGHNLDDYIKVPGLIVVNKRGVRKENINWIDLKSIKGKSSSAPRLQWTSKYGSITYNTFGKEFIDDGMNEKGLYIGEMTLIGTEYSKNDKLPKIYHHQWLQYILDNFSTVNEALESLSKILVEGHCQWHFFIADKTGDAAVVEFLEGNPVVYKDKNLPYKVLCNKTYAREIDSLKLFSGFGGKRPIDFNDTIVDRRFLWANFMLNNLLLQKSSSEVDYAFKILKQLDLGNNKWSIVYDLNKFRMYFNTSIARQIRYVDFQSFDFSCEKPAMVLDINKSLKDNVSNELITYSDSINNEYIKANWNEIDLGFISNKLLKPIIIDRLSKYPKTFKCVN
jgi:penicillin V acylase-like amidase (Ntn superfamily)